MGALFTVANSIYDQIDHGKIPKMVLPRYEEQHPVDLEHGVFKYGPATGARTAKKTNGAMMLLRTMYTLELIEDMIDKNKSSTLREMYYISEGWGKAKFHSQDELNMLAEDLEIVTKCMREDFKLRPEENGASVIGNITIEEFYGKGYPLQAHQLPGRRRRFRIRHPVQRGGGEGQAHRDRGRFHLRHRDRRYVRPSGGERLPPRTTTGCWCI